MATSPALTSLVPGSNPTGSNIAIPSPLGQSYSGMNPLYPDVSAASRSNLGLGDANPYGRLPSVPGATSSGGGVVPGTGTTTGYVPSGATANLISSGIPQQGSSQSLYNAFTTAGMQPAMASAFAKFLQGGAGYNPEVANALIAQLQPQIERGQENLLEQFSAEGNRFGSGAQTGLADYLSQTNLDVGNILSNLYEQSVQNYIQTLMGVRGQNLQQERLSMQYPGSSWESILSSVMGSIPGIGSLIKSFIPSGGGGGGGVGNLPLNYYQGGGL